MSDLKQIKSMPTLNAGNLELALDTNCKHLLRTLPDIATQTSPETAKDALLPYLAQAVAVPYWDSNLSTQEKRKLIQDSQDFYGLAGTEAAIDKALKLLNLEYSLIPWYESNSQSYTATLTIRVNREFGKDASDALRRVLSRITELRDNINIDLIIQPKAERQSLAVARTIERLRIQPA